MALRPPIQATIEQADYEPNRRSWRMALFTPEGDSVALPSVIYDEEVTNQGPIEVEVPVRDAYDVEIEGIVHAAERARWVAVLPNGSVGANSVGNYMRTNLWRNYVAPDSTVGNETQYFGERGFVLGALRYGGDTLISAKARIFGPSGAPRLARAETGSSSMDPANANESVNHIATTRWADATSVIESLVMDFDAATFTGRITVS